MTNIDPVTLLRILLTAALGIPAIMVVFMKSGPDPKIAERRKFWNEHKSPFFIRNFIIMCNEDGSLRKFTKASFFALFVVIILLAWISPIRL